MSGRLGMIGAVIAVLASGTALPATAQDLADFDYENLSFRGLAVEGGYIVPNKVESTSSIGIRADLGYLGPGLRIVPFVSYWDSELERDEVADLEASVNRLVDRQAPPGTPPADVTLGTVEWSDLVIGTDAHVVWAIPLNLLTYAGAGAAVHVLNGSGEAVDDTFVEDLLDSFRAGFNLHTGIEYPWDRFRLYGTARFEVLEDVNYFEFRLGGQIMFGSSAPGERSGS